MPQKRNPVAIEHVRAIASKALGQVMGSDQRYNTPFGDINDVEDDRSRSISQHQRCRQAVSLLSDASRQPSSI